MRRVATPWLVLAAWSGAAAAAATPERPALVAIAPRDPWTLRELEAQHVAFASYDPETGVAYVVATPAEQRRLADAGFSIATVDNDVDARARRIASSRALGSYHDYAETLAETESLAARFAPICRREIIGRSGEGRDLVALEITGGAADPSKPQVLVVGCHHAREFMSVEVPFDLAHQLLERYGTDPRITRLVDTRDIWIVPLLNPDGHVYQEQFAAGPDWQPPGWRKNRTPNLDGTFGIDINRNYSYLWGYDDVGSSGETGDDTYRGPAAFSELETQAIRRLVERHRFVISLSYHSFGKLLLYPWGYTSEVLTDDQPLFAVLADSMVRDNHHRPGNPFFGTIYRTNGDLDDYMYGEIAPRKPMRTFAFTVELNTEAEGGFWPDESLIAPTCAAMRSMNLFAIDVAGSPRAALPPPAPRLVAVQDAVDRGHIDLDWTQPQDVDNPVDHYEVFELVPGTPNAALRVQTSGPRVLLARDIAPGSDGRVAIRMRSELWPLWDYGYVEARGPDGVWRVLHGDCSRDTAPTGRNRGGGFTGRFTALQRFDARGVGAPMDIALRVDADPRTAGPARVEARLDAAATWSDTRRVLDPNVHGTHFSLHAEHGGLVAYGVTAVDADGQKTDSEVSFFVVPVTEVDLSDVEATITGTSVEVRWSGGHAGTELALFAAPSHPGDDSAAVPAGLDPVATLRSSGRGGALRWSAPPGRWRVALRAGDADGVRWFGPWSFESRAGVAILALPSPLRAGAGIELELGGSGRARLDFVAVDGRIVRRLAVDGTGSGRDRIVWDGLDAAGKRVAPGVYFVRLVQAGRIDVRRAVVLQR